LARAGGTLVLYMGVKTLPRIVAALADAGLPAETPAAAVQWGTLPRQRTVVASLATIADAIAREELSAPVITVIGEVVKLRREIAWFERRPLHGRRIVVTRARGSAGVLSERLAALGADVLEMPATRIEELDAAPLHAAIDRIHEYGWVVFTSRNAVDVFWKGLSATSRDTRWLSGVRVAAVGPSTAAALAARGVQVDVSPERFVAESLLAALAVRDDVRGARVLHAGAEAARDVLSNGLRALGARVDVVPTYRSVPDGEGAATLRARLEAGEVDLVTFTSASAVTAFVAAVGRDAARSAPAAVIGPVTESAARSAGIDVAVIAPNATILGLVDAVAGWAQPSAA
jgi:uroporphyrinogen III methyltransferase/synthase